MTILPPIIQLIHASDAPQHTAELKSILGRMKAESRISDFIALDIGTNPDNINFKNDDHQGLIVMLTHDIEQVRNDIEKSLKNLIQEKPNIKLIEIIVDNLPYHNNFISFPQDLMPIRSRVDMNTVWNGIERDLHAIFPKAEQQLETVISPKQDLKPYLKVAGVSVVALILFILIFSSAFPAMHDEAKTILGVFWTLVPILIFVRHKKDLEVSTLPNQEKKRIAGFINWKKLFIRLVIVFLVIFLSYTLWVDTREEQGVAGMLANITALPFLLYRTKSESNTYADDKENTVPSPLKKSFKFLGDILFDFLISIAFWWFVLIVFEVDDDDTLFIFFVMTIVTTIGLVVLRYRRKRTRPSQ